MPRSAPEEVDSIPVSAPKTRLSFSLASTMESVDAVEAAAEKLAAEAGLDEDERFHVTMAVREAAVNAVLPARRLCLPLPTRAGASIRRRCPTPWRRKTCCAAPGAASSSSEPSWMRYTFDNCIPEPS